MNRKLNKLTLAILATGIASAGVIAADNSAPNSGLPSNAAIEAYQLGTAQERSFRQEASEREQYPDWNALDAYNGSQVYSEGGYVVRYTDGSRWGVFENKWWTQGEAPSFLDDSGVWSMVVETDSEGHYLPETVTVQYWDASAVYVEGDKVKHTVNGEVMFFEAKYWTQGNEPILTESSGGTAADWESPWKNIQSLSDEATPPPVTPEPTPDPEITPPPPVTPEPTPDPEITPPPPVIPDPELGDDGLPEEGYEFLRDMTAENWDWYFPMRSGRYNPEGGTRNMPPYAAEDGSKDTFNFANFKRAVVEYNTWAESKGYKQFLNEGTKSQQALEFTAFWAKSARETSGSWDNAPAPWIVDDVDAGTVWKGALYWVEEVGYTTNPDGTSPTINYVDPGSSAYPPEPGRSYYGRGIIQLSWNYNYGAFSHWLYDNGMMRDIITERDTLLKRPDYVATYGDLSVLSGIWFWMTPQGAKPASHDVMMGNITHVSEFGQDMGLPQRNDGGHIPTANGESYDEAVISYRLGTVINIVNGGLECNKAAAYHTGPTQRVSYFNAFAKYVNSNIEGVDVPTIEDATDVWSVKVNSSSPENLKTATCYSQKSYYGW
ncbi:glycoside hydrolase family 19 protein [Vibrio campbellii]|uniref:glycoside hydrolase family 19 protein n=1 Tax=Vibrio campbellii TaxID=680 RepID=UPI000CD338E9|nr:glycoside hydrolase family 19 protein [Vibrio campbellii]AUW03818.1 hypothetical protein C1N51_08855 [Vibrio campbellii]